MLLRPILALSLILLLAACGTTRKTSKDVTVNLGEIEIRPVGKYQASATRVHDLLHTRLEVRFDFEKQQLLGTAQLRLKPYAKPVNSLVLDAKGFEIISLGVMEGGKVYPLNYQYDGMQLEIDLMRTYAVKDTYRLKIEYIAKPNELAKGGSDAITSDKGLYFINSLGNEKGKPVQIWTQGETEASSCWFPTIDKPNENTTQEIFITVPDTFVSLSNGLLVSSVKNTDGTRTDYWKMDLPHAPYLFMMAIGDYAVVRDSWRGKPVDYYVEKPFEPYAKDIFGNTPEMLEFFSKRLGFDYPWQKYAQVTARDYVSGAMENTTASLFFEYMQMTKRDMIDGDFENIIAHELIHQWFGDLVTCESWSNLTLNEGFATYGEYLWTEYKYGINEAEKERLDMLNGYLYEAYNRYMEPLVRFHYADKEHMFDAHSYSKGGLVLHMLRKYLGDEVFFNGVNIYLHENAFRAVEVHHLRLAFEKASGEDLNWFFNQWFLSPGHPELEVGYTYNSNDYTIAVTLKQKQQAQEVPVFRLPLAIDIYHGDAVKRHLAVMEEREQVFTFEVPSEPLFVLADADKTLLCKIEQPKTVAQLALQYQKSPGYIGKREALVDLAGKGGDKNAAETLLAALKDPYWALRKVAAERLSLNDSTKPHFVQVAETDVKPAVRAAALRRLSGLREEVYMDLFKKAVADSSFEVIAVALNAIYQLNKEEALARALDFEFSNNYRIVSLLSKMYAEKAGAEKQIYFERKMYETSGWARSYIIGYYGDFLSGKNETVIRTGIRTLEDVAVYSTSGDDRLDAATAIHDVRESLDKSKDATLIAELTAALGRIIAAEQDETVLLNLMELK